MALRPRVVDPPLVSCPMRRHVLHEFVRPDLPLRIGTFRVLRALRIGPPHKIPRCKPRDAHASWSRLLAGEMFALGSAHNLGRRRKLRGDPATVLVRRASLVTRRRARLRERIENETRIATVADAKWGIPSPPVHSRIQRPRHLRQNRRPQLVPFLTRLPQEFAHATLLRLHGTVRPLPVDGSGDNVHPQLVAHTTHQVVDELWPSIRK